MFYDKIMTHTAFRILAWLLLSAIVFATLGPLGLRPISGYPVQIERAAAFFGVGLVFVLAYPRHIVAVTVLVLLSAVGREVLQTFSFDRHGREIDAIAKIIGALAGLTVGMIATKILEMRSRF
ncbi:hypothetical protein ABIB57_004260 [Devosia sp. UYZn731]|uniref:VanZ family protein n=1 Tax=Devosia sp. UYZn731 TaxID=3156345 RepID=UPI003399309F